MFRKSLSMVAIAAAMLGAGAGFTQPAPQVTANAPRKAKRGLFGGITMGPIRTWRYRGPGITMAQQQRNSRKKRNQARHKAAVRGSK